MNTNFKLKDIEEIIVNSSRKQSDYVSHKNSILEETYNLLCENIFSNDKDKMYEIISEYELSHIKNIDSINYEKEHNGIITYLIQYYLKQKYNVEYDLNGVIYVKFTSSFNSNIDSSQLSIDFNIENFINVISKNSNIKLKMELGKYQIYYKDININEIIFNQSDVIDWNIIENTIEGYKSEVNKLRNYIKEIKKEFKFI